MWKQAYTTAFPLIIKTIFYIHNFGCDLFDTFELENILRLFNTYNICVQDLSSSGILCCLTDVSGQPVHPTFNCQAYQEEYSWITRPLEEGTDMLSRNVDNKISFYAA